MLDARPHALVDRTRPLGSTLLRIVQPVQHVGNRAPPRRQRVDRRNLRHPLASSASPALGERHRGDEACAESPLRPSASPRADLRGASRTTPLPSKLSTSRLSLASGLAQTAGIELNVEVLRGTHRQLLDLPALRYARARPLVDQFNDFDRTTTSRFPPRDDAPYFDACTSSSARPRGSRQSGAIAGTPNLRGTGLRASHTPRRTASRPCACSCACAAARPRRHRSITSTDCSAAQRAVDV